MKEQKVTTGSKQQSIKLLSPRNDYPPPSDLIEQAERETARRRVDEYAEVICKLRDEKKFTYRAIAEWLSNHGVPTDHNEIYRTHKEYCEGTVKRYFERNRKLQMPRES